MTTQTSSGSKGMHIGLWVLQCLLAVAFLMAGSFKLLTPPADLIEAGMTHPLGLLRFAGLSEVLGALGLILPAATRIKPVLTPIAAAALTLVMVLAMGSHVIVGDIAGAVPSIVLGVLAAIVAWGRTKRVPIAPRGAAVR